jgi:hypothetical protein
MDYMELDIKFILSDDHRLVMQSIKGQWERIKKGYNILDSESCNKLICDSMFESDTFDCSEIATSLLELNNVIETLDSYFLKADKQNIVIKNILMYMVREIRDIVSGTFFSCEVSNKKTKKGHEKWVKNKIKNKVNEISSISRIGQNLITFMSYDDKEERSKQLMKDIINNTNMINGQYIPDTAYLFQKLFMW